MSGPSARERQSAAARQTTRDARVPQAVDTGVTSRMGTRPSGDTSPLPRQAGATRIGVAGDDLEVEG
jgi:hypothetical protein